MTGISAQYALLLRPTGYAIADYDGKGARYMHRTTVIAERPVGITETRAGAAMDGFE